jgi:hypothetical protein
MKCSGENNKIFNQVHKMVDYDGEHTIMTIKEMKAQCPHYSLPNQNRK